MKIREEYSVEERGSFEEEVSVLALLLRSSGIVGRTFRLRFEATGAVPLARSSATAPFEC